jgi:2,5-furandicarboxylate decarboxylase 1
MKFTSPSGTSMLRRYLQFLDDSGQLVHISKSVQTKHELAAVAWKLHGRPVIFESVIGSSRQVVANLCSDRALLARMLGVSLDQFFECFLRAIEKPRPCEAVAQSSLYDVVIDKDIDLASTLPLTLDYDRQQSPGVNSGVMIARDPQTGEVNTSFHVLEAISRDEFVVHVVSPHFARIYGQYQRQGNPLPVALAIGLDPLTWMACTLAISHPPSELDVAGAIRKQPIQLVSCKTSDVSVIADAEIVLEGEILPGRREAIGPEPRPRGVYGPPTSGPVFKVRCIAHRKDALFHYLANSSPDHLNLSAISKEVTLFPYLKERYPFVIRLSCYGNTCVIAVSKRGGERVPAMLEDALRYTTADRGSFNKFAIAVDEDIEIFDRRDVEQALYTRLKPDSIVVLKGVRANQGEPSAINGRVDKIGIDATIPPGREDEYRRPYIPGVKELDLRNYLEPRLLFELD